MIKIQTQIKLINEMYNIYNIFFEINIKNHNT